MVVTGDGGGKEAEAVDLEVGGGLREVVAADFAEVRGGKVEVRGADAAPLSGDEVVTFGAEFAPLTGASASEGAKNKKKSTHLNVRFCNMKEFMQLEQQQQHMFTKSVVGC